jgi:hypothetical protein
MRRLAMIGLLAAAICAGGPPEAAAAGPACSATLDATWVVHDDVIGWMVGTNAVAATCDPAWRVALSPQYQTGDGVWHGGRRVFNHIYYPAANDYYAAGSTQALDLACCILYWDDGDGTEQFAPLCQYPWRIHAGFWTETRAGPARFADTYSDPASATCVAPPPSPR